MQVAIRALRLHEHATVIDEESERVVRGWLKLGDLAVGRRAEQGICDRCGARGYLSRENGTRVCTRCYLEGAAPHS